MRLFLEQNAQALYLILLLLDFGSLCNSAGLENRAPPSSRTPLTSSTSNASTASSILSSSSDTSIVLEVLTATIQPLPFAPKVSTQSDDQVFNPKAKPETTKNSDDDELNVSYTFRGNDLPASSQQSSVQPPKTSITNPHSSSDTPKTSSSSASSQANNGNKSPQRTSAPPTTYTNEQVTITSAPNWGDQKIPINTCTTLVNNREIQWIPCMVFAGTVQLSFFPEAQGNLTYPTTYFDPALGITLTSPSIYMIINTLTAYNPCGPVGPTYKDYILSMDLTDVSSLRPYADATARDRLGDPRQLTLADLATNCPKFSDTPEGQTLIHSLGAIIDEHPVENDWNRCNPRLAMPSQMKSVGLPYWRHCGNDNGHFGIFDPPGAVPPVQGIFPTKAPVPAPAPAPAPTAQPPPAISPLPSPTAVPVALEPQPEPGKPESAQQTNMPPLAPNPIVAPHPSPSNPDLVAPVNQNTSPITPIQSEAIPENLPNIPNLPNQSAQPPNPSVQPVNNASPQQPDVIAVIGSNTIHAGTSGIVLPGVAPASIGEIVTLTDSNNKGVVVSVGSSGIHVGTGASATYIANPTIPPLAPPTDGALTPVVTLNGEVIHAKPGATTLVIKEQTLTAGGPPVTLSGTDNVAILSHNGLIIQYPGGSASYFSLPTVAPMQPQPSKDASIVVYEGNTLSVGGPPATMTDNAVVSLGPSGVVIQRPSGTESTIPLAQLTGVASPSRNKAEEDNMGDIIAGMMGIQTVQPSGETESPIVAASVSSRLLSSKSSNTPSATGPQINGTVTAALLDGGSKGTEPLTVSTVAPVGNTSVTPTDVPKNLEASSGSRTIIWEGGCMIIALVAILVL